MKKRAIMLVAMFLFPLLLNAGHVFVWNYDILDTFYDSEVGSTIDCAYWLEQTITANGHTYVTDTILPADLSPYDAVLATLGWFRCWGDNSTVAPAEQTKLIDYLYTGKGLYIEGPDFGYNNSSTQLYQKFGCTYAGDGNASGNVQTVTGQTGTMTDGFSYDYLYGQGPDSYVDVIGENGGTLFFQDQNTRGRAIMYDGPSGEYRAIHSTFIFGALRNGTNTKNELMDAYIGYLFSGPVGVEEYEASRVVGNLSIFPNPAFERVKLTFSLSHPRQVCIKVYNSAGQLVRQLMDRNLTAGAHQLFWDGTDDSDRTLSSGCYVVRIDADGEVLSKMITLVK